jgi:hypothetical protein
MKEVLVVRRRSPDRGAEGLVGRPAPIKDHNSLPLDLQSSGQAADYQSASSKNVIH